jgi:release factor glutamine methyltransferase
MAQSEPWTIGRLVAWTTDYLKNQGADSPRLDAEILLAHARGCSRIDLYTAWSEVPAESLRDAFRALVRRRAEGTPVAYLVGRREFYSLSFQVTPDVLIPRPETEFLLVALFDRVKACPPAGPLAIADVGTGSGAVAVCAARQLAGAQITAIDVSRKALEVARRNVEQHEVQGQVTLVEGDLLSSLSPEARFHYVVSNPPYVARHELLGLKRDVRDHEPHLALDGGETGTQVIGRLIPQAADRLEPGGWLILEVSPMIEEDVRKLLLNDGRYEEPMTLKDLAGLARVIQACRRSG